VDRIVAEIGETDGRAIAPC